MNKLCIFVGMTVLGYATWLLGEWLDLGFFGCFLASGAGSLAGVYVGWRIARHLG